jgi:RND family efflux transporter MFP subunit
MSSHRNSSRPIRLPRPAQCLKTARHLGRAFCLRLVAALVATPPSVLAAAGPIALGAPAAAGLVALTLTSCKKDQSAQAKDPPKTVRVQKIGRADIEHILTYPADLKPFAEVRVFSRVADRILSFPWEDGDEIKRGQRVAIIRTEGMHHGLVQIAAQRDALDAQLNNQELELGRLKELLAKGSVAQAEYDRLDSSYRAAKAQRRALTASEGQLAANVADGVLTAAIGGVIADKSVEAGDIAAPSVPLCRIIQVGRLKVELRLVEADVPKVKLGQNVMLHLDAYPKRTFQGQVSVLLPYVDPQTRTNTVEITVDNPKDESTGKWLLKPGMYGRAELVVERHSQVLVAPEPALLLDNQLLKQQEPGEDLRKAFVVDQQGIARKRIVKLGARKGSLWEVLDGIQQDERLVVRGQHGLKDGQRVEIVDAAKQ